MARILLAIIISLLVNGSNGDIWVPPQNAAFFAGIDTLLVECASNLTSSPNSVTWTVRISPVQPLIPGSPFQGIQTGSNPNLTYLSLQDTTVDSQNAGIYKCTDGSNMGATYSSLIVIMENVTSDICDYPRTPVNEGDTVNFYCQLRYYTGLNLMNPNYVQGAFNFDTPLPGITFNNTLTSNGGYLTANFSVVAARPDINITCSIQFNFLYRPATQVSPPEQWANNNVTVPCPPILVPVWSCPLQVTITQKRVCSDCLELTCTSTGGYPLTHIEVVWEIDGVVKRRGPADQPLEYHDKIGKSYTCYAYANFTQCKNISETVGNGTFTLPTAPPLTTGTGPTVLPVTGQPGPTTQNFTTAYIIVGVIGGVALLIAIIAAAVTLSRAAQDGPQEPGDGGPVRSKPSRHVFKPSTFGNGHSANGNSFQTPSWIAPGTRYQNTTRIVNGMIQ